MDDDMIVRRETSKAETPNKRILAPAAETFSNAFQHTVCDINVTALTGDANPDAVKLGFRLGRKTKLIQ